MSDVPELTADELARCMHVTHNEHVSVLLDLKKAREEIARLRKMRTSLQDILGHTVPKNLSPELAEMWAAAIKVLEG